ncbi:MAG: nucleotidyltransferase domain-containing protein [Cyanobacteria bacterium P01_F01_bin.143]
MKRSPIAVAEEIFHNKYADSELLLLAGSTVRNEATPTSDLDLVILYDNIESAYRDSYYWDEWPIEAFVHNLETLRYFFELDRKSGVPSLPNMVVEGIEIPEISNLSISIKTMATEFLKKGPPIWEREDIDSSRYAITELVEDFKYPRSSAELYGTASILYSVLANHYFRSQNIWSAKGKSIPRRFQQVDPDLANQFNEAFDLVFACKDITGVIAIAEKILNQDGGFLFSGYKVNAPSNWKIKLHQT